MPSGALRHLFLFAEFVAALTRRGLRKRFTLDRGDDHTAMHKNHVGQAAAKRGDQCPEQEFADLYPGLFQFLSHVFSSLLCYMYYSVIHELDQLSSTQQIMPPSICVRTRSSRAGICEGGRIPPMIIAPPLS